VDRPIKTIDAYIGTFPDEVQVVLQQVRQTIRMAAPGALEAISYGMPTFKLNGRNLVHFAAWEHHVGFYPTPSGIASFEKELAPYVQGKGSVQFPLDQPMPIGLLEKIVRYRVHENVARARAKS
jgi:uncharacterized protein YdhG (YjbR/CyaY superfamily)